MGQVTPLHWVSYCLWLERTSVQCISGTNVNVRTRCHVSPHILIVSCPLILPSHIVFSSCIAILHVPKFFLALPLFFFSFLLSFPSHCPSFRKCVVLTMLQRCSWLLGPFWILQVCFYSCQRKGLSGNRAWKSPHKEINQQLRHKEGSVVYCPVYGGGGEGPRVIRWWWWADKECPWPERKRNREAVGIAESMKTIGFPGLRTSEIASILIATSSYIAGVWNVGNDE